MAYRLDIPPHVADVVRHLAPDLKRSIKAALRYLRQNPEGGEPLVGELRNLWKYRVRRFRVVYAIDRNRRLVRVFAIGPRRGIYDHVTERRRPEG
ncbi:MAG: type II toxin-antitoxin system RelE family toxin [Candidatus Rokuibacteriota bacterium]